KHVASRWLMAPRRGAGVIGGVWRGAGICLLVPLLLSRESKSGQTERPSLPREIPRRRCRRRALKISSARLRVGGEHAERALEFYEPVGAVRRIREARSLLAKRA